MEKRRERYLYFGLANQLKPETFRVCDKVNERLEEEITFLVENHMISEIGGLKRVCDHLKEHGIPYMCPGATASLYSLFDLGITRTNPIDPHYFCPKCRTFEFIDDIEDGYDLPSKICQTCGTLLHNDGHNITFDGLREQRYEINEGEPVVYLAVSEKHYDEVIKLLTEEMDSSTHIEQGVCETQIGHIILQKHPMSSKWNVTSNEKISTQGFKDYAMDGFLRSSEIDPVILMTLEKHGVQASKFSEVIRVYGISHMPMLPDALNELLKSGVGLGDIPSFYDEVYLEALKWGCTPKEAAFISHKSHYGVCRSEFLTKAPEYIRDWLPNVLYMFPKSHALEMFHLNYLSL